MPRKRRAVQLRLTRPVRQSRVKYLTKRQRELLAILRWGSEPVHVDLIARQMGYAYPRAACDRLVRRGLAVKVSSGLYRARVLSERRA